MYRLSGEEGLALKKRPQRRRKVVRYREGRFIATAPDQAWSLDFVADQLQDWRRFRSLTIVDIFTRESVAIEVGQSLRGEDMVRTQNGMKHEGLEPKLLFCDNGSEFAGQAMDLWAYQNSAKDRCVASWQADRQRLHRIVQWTFRGECLNAHWSETLTEAKQLIETWRQEYNRSGPHRSIGERTPGEFASECAASLELTAT